MPQKLCLGVLITDKGTGVDITVARPVLQGDAPLPAIAASGTTSKRRGLSHRRSWGSHSAVTGQPWAPVIVPDLERLLNQQTAKAGTIHEQASRHGLPAIHYQCTDIA